MEIITGQTTSAILGCPHWSVDGLRCVSCGEAIPSRFLGKETMLRTQLIGLMEIERNVWELEKELANEIQKVIEVFKSKCKEVSACEE